MRKDESKTRYGGYALFDPKRKGRNKMKTLIRKSLREISKEKFGIKKVRIKAGRGGYNKMIIE